MERRGVVAVFTCVLLLIPCGHFQNVDSGAMNIFDALSTLNCGQFKSLIISAGEQTQDYYQRTPDLTVFAPNDTAFQQMLPDRRQKIINMSPAEKRNYVLSYTLPKLLQTSSMTETLIEESMGGPGSTKMFFNRRARRPDDIVSGTAGRTEFYANGALIYKTDVRASNGIIQVIDRVLDPIITSKVYGYVQQPNLADDSISHKFYTELTRHLTGDYIKEAITPIQVSSRLTMFLPTDEAFSKIPSIKLDDLRSKQVELAKVVKQHVIPNKAVYTSFVYHNEGYQCMGQTRAIFKKNIKDFVYVSAGGVTAEIIQGNLTLANGVIHFVDSVLGFVYNTALEQVQLDEKLREFERVLGRGRSDLQDNLVAPSGVTVFVPMNDAFAKLNGIPDSDLVNNQSLIDMVLELHMLEDGNRFEITNVNGDYQARFEARSQYRGRKIYVYSQGNDTWAEGGYVKTRVLRPDVGVTNGLVQYIDGVFGVPYRDIPGLVYCEDWLIKSSYILGITGLNDNMFDPRITVTPPACGFNDYLRKFGYPTAIGGSSSNKQYVTTMQASGSLGCENARGCSYTLFVPNGTTVDYFQNSYYGREIFKNNDRLRYVLKRHIAVDRKIYIDQMSLGQHYFTSATNDEIRLNRITSTYSEIIFQDVRARVIHQDLGATNGVIHIVDRFLFVPFDLQRDISASTRKLSSVALITATLFFSFCQWLT